MRMQRRLLTLVLAIGCGDFERRRRAPTSRWPSAVAQHHAVGRGLRPIRRRGLGRVRRQGGGDVMIAVSRDGGQSFGAPVRVNAVAGEARISGEIAPRVALMPRRRRRDPSITVLWNAKDGGTQIKTARSLDGGRRFGAPIGAAGAGGAGRSRLAGADGRMRAACARDLARPSRHGGGRRRRRHPDHKGEHDGAAMAQKSGLYYRTLPAAEPVERELFKGVRYCCKTALATGPTVRSSPRGGMCSPVTSATWVHGLARWRPVVLAAPARQ